MIIGFDLDGTLDKPSLAGLCQILLAAGHEVHIITGTFPEAAGWQDAEAKRRKLNRLRISFTEQDVVKMGAARLHVLNAVPSTFDRDYRLADLGLRKGALCEELGIEIFFDDSALYCEMIPKMDGDVTVLQVH